MVSRVRLTPASNQHESRVITHSIQGPGGNDEDLSEFTLSDELSWNGGVEDE